MSIKKRTMSDKILAESNRQRQLQYEINTAPEVKGFKKALEGGRFVDVLTNVQKNKISILLKSLKRLGGFSGGVATEIEKILTYKPPEKIKPEGKYKLTYTTFKKKIKG